MYRILVVDSSAIDRRMMHDVLEKSFRRLLSCFRRQRVPRPRSSSKMAI